MNLPNSESATAAETSPKVNRSAGDIGLSDALIALVVFVLGMGVYVVIGLNWELMNDEAIFLYGGLRLLEGELPYTAMFDPKGPLAQFLVGLGAALAKIGGWETWEGARLLFTVMAVASGSVLYLVARTLGLPRAWSLVAAALLLLGFQAYTFFALSGPRPKIAVVFFQCLAMFYFARQRWMPFGIATGLATLVWQPSVLIALAAYLTTPRAQWITMFVRTALGGIIVALACLLIYVVTGNLQTFIDAFFFVFIDMARGGSLVSTVEILLKAIFIDMSASSFVIVGGLLVALAWLFGPSSYRRFLAVMTLLFILLCFLDFQGPADFIVLLPLATLGFISAVVFVLNAFDLPADQRVGIGPASLSLRQVTVFVVFLICITPIMAASLQLISTRLQNDYAGRTIQNQIKEARQIASTCSEPDCIYYLGAMPELALGGRKNATRYGFITTGIGDSIDRIEPGGIDVWLENLTPEIVMFTNVWGPGEKKIFAWLRGNYTPAPEIDELAWRRNPPDQSADQ